MKIGIVGAELLHAGGQAGRQAGVTKLIVAVRGFADMLCIVCYKHIWFLRELISFGLLFFFSMG
jgi:hypothetical protein